MIFVNKKTWYIRKKKLLVYARGDINNFHILAIFHALYGFYLCFGEELCLVPIIYCLESNVSFCYHSLFLRIFKDTLLHFFHQHQLNVVGNISPLINSHSLLTHIIDTIFLGFGA